MSNTARRRPGLGGALHLETLEDRAVPAVIGGVVYNDLNRDGLIGGGEPGIAGTQLRLLDSAGQVVATTTSDRFGHYRFTQRDGVSATPNTLTREAEFGPSRTDLSRTAGVDQFDPRLGTLTAVSIEVEGGVQAQVQLENLGGHQATLRSDLSASIQVQAPGAGLIEAKPKTSLEAPLASFDGQLDLAGTSGKNFGATRLDGQFTGVTVTNPADLAAYVGSGQVTLTQNASVTSSTSGPGNLLALIQSTASGKVKVVYHYTPSSDLGPGKYTIVQTQPAGYQDWFETNDNSTPLPNSNRSDSIEVTVTDASQVLFSNHFGERLPQAPPVTPQPLTHGEDVYYPGKLFFTPELLIRLGIA